MPSPFPGMNPYLEDTGRWHGFHTHFITEIGAAVNGLAPSHYFADIEERVYLIDEHEFRQRYFVPDAFVGESREVSGEEVTPGGVATLAPVKAKLVLPDEGVQEREHRLVIRSTRDERVVTVIEVLSPSNKTGGSTGRNVYLQKRNEVLHSDSHFVEIDLLRGGRRVQDVPRHSDFEYLVCVSRSEERPDADWWPILLEESLPKIPIPLTAGDPDVVIDLQQLLHQVYDRGGYRRTLDYSEAAPPPELSDERQAWLAEAVS